MKQTVNVPKKKKYRIKKSVLFKSIALFVAFVSFFVFLFFIKLDVLPWKYLLLVFFFLFCLDGGLYYLLSRRNYKARMIGSILAIFFVFFFFMAIYFQSATLHFLENISILNIETETYNVLVLKGSNIQSVKDLKNSTVSYVDNRKGVLKALKELSKEVDIQEHSSSESSIIINDLLAKKVDAILMEQAEVKLYQEMMNDFYDNTHIIDSIEVHVDNENSMKEVKITKEPFSVFVTGIDTYGKLSSVSRSDVNMVITVNPLTHKILLTSIPRDYYVQIHGTSGLKDKLTHAGLKGVDTSIQTIEDLLKTDINYYVKINFTSLVQIIDAIGGVDVDNPFEFTADYVEDTGAVYYVYKKGVNHLDGRQALAYVRERYGLREGDVARARHQQQVIKGMIDKLMSPVILTSYTKILGSIEGNFATNMSLSNLTGFIQKQLDENPSWTIDNMVLSGIDSSELTASMPELYSAVMLPDEESVNSAISKIKSLKEER